jgi:hypothetical protein
MRSYALLREFLGGLMKFLMPVLLAAFLLVGCEKIEGQLNITKDLKLENSKGVMHLLKVGTYSADLNAQSSKKFTLRINNDRDEKFIFEYNGSLPQNGPFYISSKVSGQPVDLFGTIATVVTKSEVRQTTRSCNYQVAVQVCYPNPRGGRDCRIEYRTIMGTQWISYYEKLTKQDVDLDVKAADATEVSADFHGDIAYAENIIVNETNCR